MLTVILRAPHVLICAPCAPGDGKGACDGWPVSNQRLRSSASDVLAMQETVELQPRAAPQRDIATDTLIAGPGRILPLPCSHLSNQGGASVRVTRYRDFRIGPASLVKLRANFAPTSCFGA